MDWVNGLNKAINFIEDNLLEQLSCKDIAQHIFISNYHFQRVFSLMTGITVGEYIRNRRLSLSGQELVISNKKVIDVALKYGYETPESFTKAFTRFHNITPNQAKQEGAVLKSFNRLIVKTTLEGGSIMDYRIIKKDAFKVMAKTKLFSTESNLEEIPKFWTEYYSNGLCNKVWGRLGICKMENEEFILYGIGREYNENESIPEGFEILTVPSYVWAIFKCIGPMPDAIQSTWEKIYNEWLPQSDYELISDYDMEYYTDRFQKQGLHQ